MKSLRALCVISAAVTSTLSAATHRLGVAGDMASLVSRLEPGDVVLLPNATWSDQTIAFRGKGTAAKPITLRAENPGQFILTGKSHLVIDGEWLVVEGMALKNGGPEGDGIAIRGKHNRLTQSVVDGGTYKFFVHLFGTHHRVDHCYFANKTSGDPTFQIEVDAAEPNYHQVDRNHFGYREPLGRNGGETMRVGYSGQSMSNSRTVVEQNLFERCDGEIEIISSKSCENTYRGNTFLDCAGMLTLRHGDRCVVDGNFFLGRGKKGSGGIRIIGEDHVVTNNYIEGVMQGGFWITSGVPNSALNQYYVAKRALVAFNTVVDSAGPYLELASGLGGAGRTLKPEAITIANNVLMIGRGGTLLKGDEGEGWKWCGNLASGESAEKAAHAGIRFADARLERGTDGLFRPAANSAARGSAEGDFPAVKVDIDGQPRTGKRDVGCDQASDAPIMNRPLTAKDVGPTWRL